MKIKIFLTAFLLLIIGSVSPVFANPISELPPAEIQPGVDDHTESTRHTGRSVFSVPTSGESEFNFRDRLPNSNSEEHSKDKNDHASASDLIQRKCSLYFIDFPEQIDCSQSIKILLFPFHSHL